jgi:hypothetical protein
MTNYIEKIFLIVFLIFVAGCANNTQPTPQSTTVPQSCLSTYQYYSSKNLCDIYWDNKNWRCDNDIRILLRDRGQSVAPRSTCGQAINSSHTNTCNLTNITQLTSASLCNAYYSTNNCNTEIRNELTKRNLKLTPRNECGLSLSSPSNACNLTNITQLTPTSLCNIYYSTSNCNTEIRRELTQRNLKSTPKDDCGTSLNANSNIQLIKINVGNQRCQSYLNEIYNNPSPLKAACMERYKSIRDETIICRQNLTSFITANSRGVGTSLETCGIRN